MKASHDLFNLVKSLSKTEKRYVSLYLSTSFHGSNKKSLQLFRAVSKQETYNEAAIKKQLGAARFSAEKNKLFELVLDSMMHYYRDRTEEKKITTLRHQGAFLFAKNLRTAGWRYLRKSIQLANTYESVNAAFPLLYRENLEIRRSSPGEVKFSADELYRRNERMIRWLEEDLELDTLFTEIAELEKRHGAAVSNADVTAQLKRIIARPVMDKKRALTSFPSKITRLDIYAMYYTMTADHLRLVETHDEQVKLYEKNPELIAWSYGRYLDVLLNRLQAVTALRDYNRFDRLLSQTRKSVNGLKKYFGFHIDFIQFYALDMIELSVLCEKGDAKHGPDFLAGYEKRIPQYGNALAEAERVRILFLVATYNFYLGNLKKALAFYNELIRVANTRTGENYQAMTRLAGLLLHYDLGHADLLSSLSHSAERALKKQGHFGVFEKQLVHFFRQAPEKNDKAKLKQLNGIIQQYAGAATNYGTWCNFAFKAWADSRMENKPLHEIVAKHAMKNAANANRS